MFSARAAAAALFVTLAAAAAIAAAALEPPAARAGTFDDRVYAIASQLMCPVCAGQTVAESDSAVAREMRDVIQRKLQAGESPAAILRFFVGQFGESVLAEPPKHGLPLLLYLGPLASVVGGLAIAVFCIRRWAARPAEGRVGGPDETAPARPAIPAAIPGDAPDRARLAREIEARDR